MGEFGLLERFVQDCRAYEITIPANYRVRPHESSGVRLTFTPIANTIHMAIARAARDLRRNPQALLLGAQIIPPALRERHGGQLAMQTLMNLLNPPEPAPKPPRRQLRIESSAVSSIGACSLVEHDFGLAFAQMQRPGERLTSGVDPFGYEFITERNQVVAVGKGYGEPSVLSLAPIAINGRTYPAGTVMRADTAAHEGRSLEGGNRSNISYKEVRHVPFQAITQAAGMRLTAFAFDDPTERITEFGPVLQETSSVSEPIVRDATIQNLQAIAQAAFRIAF